MGEVQRLQGRIVHLEGRLVDVRRSALEKERAMQAQAAMEIRDQERVLAGVQERHAGVPLVR